MIPQIPQISKALLLVLAYAWLGVGLIAQDVQHPENERPLVKKAINILAGESLIVERHAPGFSAGGPTELAWAFSIINREPDAVDLFRKLALTESYYGLIGLFGRDKATYQVELGHFRGALTVTVVRGDNFSEVPRDVFIKEHIGERGLTVFSSLIFEKLPNWTDTVKVTPISND